MKTYLITAIVALLSFSCERKEVTVNPPAENKTTIVTPGPSTTEKKTDTKTTITPGGTTTEKTETTEKK